jgi:multidrug efflux system membrane fusion protein
MQGANDSYVYVVKPDNTVERRTVKIAATQEGIAVIEQGLALGEKVVVDGQYRLTNGARIRIDTPRPEQTKPEQTKPDAAQAAHNKG